VLVTWGPRTHLTRTQPVPPRERPADGVDAGVRIEATHEGDAVGHVRVLPAAALERLAKGADEHVRAVGLGQELHRARLHGADRHRDIAVTGEEDDGHLDTVGDELLQVAR